jgi:hypothetical protein
MTDVALRYRIEKGDEWWHVLDTHAGVWDKIVDRHPSEPAAQESCRKFNEGTHPLVEEMRLGPQEWRAVVRLLRWSEWYAIRARQDGVDFEFAAVRADLAPLRERMGW